MLTHEEVSDRLEILELLNTWSDIIDTGAHERYEALFTDDAVIDFSSIGSPGTDPSSHRKFLDEIAWPSTRGQQHLLGNTQFLELDGEQARTRTACHASVVMRDGSFSTICVWYVDDLKKVDGRWLISKRVCLKNFFNPDAWVNPAEGQE